MNITKEELEEIYRNVLIVEHYYRTIENAYTHDLKVKEALENIRMKVSKIVITQS